MNVRFLLILVLITICLRFLAGFSPQTQFSASTNGITTRISISSNGSQGNDGSTDGSISSNGRYVTFSSDANNLVFNDTNDEADIFVYDRIIGVTERVSISSFGAQADDFSVGPTVSQDGRYVAFYSHSTNLVSGDTNGQGDVFVHDQETGLTQRVSVLFTIFVGWPVHSTSYCFTFASPEICFRYDVN